MKNLINFFETHVGSITLFLFVTMLCDVISKYVHFFHYIVLGMWAIMGSFIFIIIGYGLYMTYQKKKNQ